MQIIENSKNVDVYLKRYAWPQTLLQPDPSSRLSLCVIIPVFEEPDLLTVLQQLRKNEYPGTDVEILVVINQSEICNATTDEANQLSNDAATQFASELCPDWIRFHIFWIKNLPDKHAGVGLARKIGMDEALKRISAAGNVKKGVLICLDADCCIKSNYLKTIANHFLENPVSPGCSINFRHQESQNPQIQSAINSYELHLRYHVHALRYCRFPHAFYTIGSSMACRAEAYAQAGGMNRRKAGEDFYFLHKIIPRGYFTEIKETTVYPSPRASHRVPFGTGRAVGKQIINEGPFLTYNWKSFEPLQQFLRLSLEFRQMKPENIAKTITRLPNPIVQFLDDIGAEIQIKGIVEKTRQPESFHKAFYQWFNGFTVLKYLHYVRDHFYEEEPIEEAATSLLKVMGNKDGKVEDTAGLLSVFRQIDEVL